MDAPDLRDDCINDSESSVQNEEPRRYWTSKKIFSLINFVLANFAVGALYALLGPFFPQEVRGTKYKA